MCPNPYVCHHRDGYIPAQMLQLPTYSATAVHLSAGSKNMIHLVAVACPFLILLFANLPSSHQALLLSLAPKYHMDEDRFASTGFRPSLSALELFSNLPIQYSVCIIHTKSCE